MAEDIFDRFRRRLPVPRHHYTEPPVHEAWLTARGIVDDATRRVHTLPGELPDVHTDDDFACHVELLSAAWQYPTRVFVHGDSDADGMMSARIVSLTLRTLAQLHGNHGLDLSVFAPSRHRRWFDVERVPSDAQLVVILDQALTQEQIDRMPEGVRDILHLDHHAPSQIADDRLCSAYADSLESDLTTAGLAWLVCDAVLAQAAAKLELRAPGRRQLDRVRGCILQCAAVGTVADVAPMSPGHARTVTMLGLDHYRGHKSQKHRDSALVAACRASGATQCHVTPSSVGWELGPAINALGRIDTAGSRKIRELISIGADLDKTHAKYMGELNAARKEAQWRATAKILKQFEGREIRRVEMVHIGTDHSIGGPLASRIAEQLGCVVGVSSFPSDADCYASFRCPPGMSGLHLGQMLDAVAQSIGYGSRGGGHEQAAAMSPAGGRMMWDSRSSRSQMRSRVAAHMPDGVTIEKPDPDAAIPAERLHEVLAMAPVMWAIQPIGHGFRPPLIRVHDMDIMREWRDEVPAEDDDEDPAIGHRWAFLDDGTADGLRVYVADPRWRMAKESLTGMNATMDLRVESDGPERVKLYLEKLHVDPNGG